MHSFLRRFFAQPATADDVKAIFRAYEERVTALEQRTSQLENALRQWAEEHERLNLAFNSFRGRVYAWRKWEPEQQEPKQPDLADPKLTKAELRARLITPGKPYPHKN
jgi:hypothetical protein